MVANQVNGKGAAGPMPSLLCLVIRCVLMTVHYTFYKARYWPIFNKPSGHAHKGH